MFMITVTCDICGKELKSGDINIIKVDDSWRYDCCNSCKDKVENKIKESVMKNDKK